VQQRSLIPQIGVDLKSVFTRKENLLILGVGLGLAGAVSPLDSPIDGSRFNRELYEGGALDTTFDPGAVIGGAAVVAGGTLATYGLGKLLSNPGIEDLGRDLIRAEVVTMVLTQGVKFVAGRQRPDGSNNRSFPSGHASATFAAATVLQGHYGWKVGIPAYAVAGYVAASRMSEAKHYLSDVVFGASLGILAGRTVTVPLGDNRFAVGPLIVPGGYGIQLSLLDSRGEGEHTRRARTGKRP